MTSNTLAEQCQAIWPCGWKSCPNIPLGAPMAYALVHGLPVEVGRDEDRYWVSVRGWSTDSATLRSLLEITHSYLKALPPVPDILPLDLHGILRQELRGWMPVTTSSGVTVYNWRDLRVTPAGTARLNLWCDHGAKHVRAVDLPPDVTQQDVSEALAKLLAFPRYP